MNWLQAMTRLNQDNMGYVLVTVLSIKGSSPRDAQAKMVVDSEQSYDTIGGGNLEFQAIQVAREFLQSGGSRIEIQQFSLGNDLSQCCGGQVELLFETFPACDFQIALFGAGHVGKALAGILKDLPCRVSWFDSRPDLLQQSFEAIGSPGTITPTPLNNPFETVSKLPTDCFYLVMTHSHEIDFELCEAILNRSDIKYCGLIGSKSKASSFKGRLRRKQYSEDELQRLTSPMGIDIGGAKQPMAVAVSIAAEIMKLQSQSAKGNQPSYETYEAEPKMKLIDLETKR